MKKETAKPPKYAQTGWCWSNSIIFFDQHHPGAHQEMGHPSPAEEGTLLFSYCNSLTPARTVRDHRPRLQQISISLGQYFFASRDEAPRRSLFPSPHLPHGVTFTIFAIGFAADSGDCTGGRTES